MDTPGQQFLIYASLVVPFYLIFQGLGTFLWFPERIWTSFVQCLPSDFGFPNSLSQIYILVLIGLCLCIFFCRFSSIASSRVKFWYHVSFFICVISCMIDLVCLFLTLMKFYRCWVLFYSLLFGLLILVVFFTVYMVEHFSVIDKDSSNFVSFVLVSGFEMRFN